MLLLIGVDAVAKALGDGLEHEQLARPVVELKQVQVCMDGP